MSKLENNQLLFTFLKEEGGESSIRFEKSDTPVKDIEIFIEIFIAMIQELTGKEPDVTQVERDDE